MNERVGPFSKPVLTSSFYSSVGLLGIVAAIRKHTAEDAWTEHFQEFALMWGGVFLLLMGIVSLVMALHKDMKADGGKA